MPQKLTVLQIQKLLLKEDITSVQAFFFLIALMIRAIKLSLLQDGYNYIFMFMTASLGRVWCSLVALQSVPRDSARVSATLDVRHCKT